MTRNLFLEIGTEELPYSCIIEAKIGLKNILEQNLNFKRIGFNSVVVFATPRRIVAFAEGLDESQKDLENIITGPPKKISFDSSGNPTQAALGFAKSLNKKVSDLIEVDTEKGIYLAVKTVEKGKKTIEILPEILKSSILSLSFSKQMTWGNYSIKFARPIRWICAFFGNEIVRFEIENIKSLNKTYGNRYILSKELEVFPFDSIEEYCSFLEKQAIVVLDDKKRKEMILNSIKKYEEEVWHGKYKAVIDEDLLDEVVNLVEYPNVLVGNFPEEYLYIPKEILVKAIQHHQRYFAVVENNGNNGNNGKNGKNGNNGNNAKVSTFFIAIQNGLEDKKGEIIKGNERVLRARLSDAKFFYEEDKKCTFEQWFEKLKGVVYYSGLGSMSDKSIRLSNISQKILEDLNSNLNSNLNLNLNLDLNLDLDLNNHNSFIEKDLKNKNEHSLFYDISDDVKRACLLCKCDLVTNMVVEFPELQGLVGREYAKEKGEKDVVCEAIFEHYLPRFANDILPATNVGAVVSIADKIDTISSMFLVGNIPSGSQDPFALRRKASGIISICLDKEFDLDIFKLSLLSVNLLVESFGKSLNLQSIDLNRKENELPSIVEKISKEITEFIIARYRFRLEKSKLRIDIFDAIIATGLTKIVSIDKKYNALLKYLQGKEKEHILIFSEPLTRCKNIIKGKEFTCVKAELLNEKEEKNLYEELIKKEEKIKVYLKKGSFLEAIEELAGFAKYINSFFDKVLVMDKNNEIRLNRLSLVKRCADLYNLYADFSKISI